MFNNKVVAITGGANGIGQRLAERFTAEGAHVCIFDIKKNDYFTGDLAEKADLEAFSAKVIETYGHIDFLINNALPPMIGIDTCSYEQFQRALSIGVAAPFYLSKLLLPHFNSGASIINISSTRSTMSQPMTESYSAAKGGISSLTHALAVSLRSHVRVNSISPGWIDTNDEVYSGPNAEQHPAGRVGTRDDIVNMVFFLCSEQASFITGQDFVVDGGMSKQMIYHNDQGWTYNN